MAKKHAPKRSKFERERDNKICYKMYLQGIPIPQIPKLLKEKTESSYDLTERQIYYDIEKMTNELKKHSVRDVDEEREKLLFENAVLKEEYWEGWRDSKSRKTRTLKKGKLSKLAMAMLESDQQAIKEEMFGDPRFLAGVESCLDRYAKLLGLNKPEKHEILLDPNKLNDFIDFVVKTIKEETDDDTFRRIDKKIKTRK